MIFEIKNNIWYTGKIDWELKKFHGAQLTTDRGSSYNSYLIRDEKNVLIDTVWTPHADEFTKNLQGIIDPKEIDYFIVTHAEPDHSGALTRILELNPDIQVYCSKGGGKSIRGYYPEINRLNIVRTGDKLSIGSREFTFIDAPFLHWPDTMMCHLSGDNILFSSDVFGQHFAADPLNASFAGQEILMYESLKYYANIIAPFSNKVVKKIEELNKLDLPIDMICTAHGVIWDENPRQIIEAYEKWADSYSENQVTIFYDTMYNSTRKMADYIAGGIRAADPDIRIKIYNSSKADKSELLTEVFRSKGILAGSPTHNGGILASVAAMLEEIEGLNLKGKKAAAFGSYGWAEKATGKILDSLGSSGFEIIGEGLKCQWAPDEEVKRQCLEYGRKFAEGL